MAAKKRTAKKAAAGKTAAKRKKTTAKRRGPGRPTKRDDSKDELILKALRRGLSIETAADFAGVHRTTVHAWIRSDEDFATAIKKTQAEGRETVVGKLFSEMEGGSVGAIIFWLKTRTTEFREFKAVEGARVSIDLPDLSNAEGCKQAAAKVTAAMAKGELPVDQGKAILDGIERARGAIDSIELKQIREDLEAIKKLKGSRKS